MQCVILAGGLGTRIRSVAGEVPKALIPVAGLPFALHQLAWLRRQGVSRVVYCIGDRGEAIREALRDADPVGLDIAYSEDGPVLLGTGGAIRLACDRGLLESAFLVLYADSYLPIAIAPAWAASGEGRHPLMVVIRNEGRWDASNVLFADGRVVRYEKNLPDPAAAGMRFIDYGLSVLPRRLIEERIPAGEASDLSVFYERLSRDGALLGHEVHQRFYEIGSPTGLAELRAHLEGPNGRAADPGDARASSG